MNYCESARKVSREDLTHWRLGAPKKQIALPGRPRLTANILANFQGLEGRHEKWTARIFTQEVLNTDALLSWKERENL